MSLLSFFWKDEINTSFYTEFPNHEPSEAQLNLHFRSPPPGREIPLRLSRTEEVSFPASSLYLDTPKIKLPKTNRILKVTVCPQKGQGKPSVSEASINKAK